MLRYTTDRARPGLVALYDIRPGNGAGQFLQVTTLKPARGCRLLPDFDEVNSVFFHKMHNIVLTFVARWRHNFR